MKIVKICYDFFFFLIQFTALKTIVPVILSALLQLMEMFGVFFVFFLILFKMFSLCSCNFKRQTSPRQKEVQPARARKVVFHKCGKD